MRATTLIFAILACSLFAREPEFHPGNYAINLSKYSFIDTSLNVIQYPKGSKTFEPFFNKLDTLVFENRGQVKILHIGGSHIQADVISGRIREHLIKEYPGASAGRGFVFPYSAAKTNTPASYGSYYKGIWDMSKNVLREVNKPLGLLGIAVSTSDPRAEISILLDKYNTHPIWSETRLRLFGFCENGNMTPILHVDSIEVPGVLDTVSQSYLFTPPRPIDSIRITFDWQDTIKRAEVLKFITDSLYKDSVERAKADSISKELAKKEASKKEASKKDSKSKKDTSKKDTSKKVATIPEEVYIPADSMYQDSSAIDTTIYSQNANFAVINDSTKAPAGPSRPKFTLTGILTENDAPGIVYTSVGINGARVPNYFEDPCPFFEKELKYVKPDLVIFAIGINDANVERFNDKGFRANYDTLITRILKVNPNAALIFETNNDSFRKIKKNKYVQHPNGELARKSFFMLAEKYGAGVWDKFSIMGGLGSMAKWEKADLAKKDKVHFKLSGYNLLGDLFYKAFIRSYQEHIANLPAQAPVAPKPAPKKTEPTKK